MKKTNRKYWEAQADKCLSQLKESSRYKKCVDKLGEVLINNNIDKKLKEEHIRKLLDEHSQDPVLKKYLKAAFDDMLLLGFETDSTTKLRNDLINNIKQK